MKAVIKVLKYLVVFIAGAITPIILFFKFLKKFPDAIDTCKEWVIKTLADLFGLRVQVFRRSNYIGYRPRYYSPYTRYTPSYRSNSTMMPDDLRFDSEEEAKKVLNYMKDIIDDFGYCTINDYYVLSEKSEKWAYTQRLYGWTDLSGAYIEEGDDGFVWKLILPEAKCLDKNKEEKE